MMAASCTVAVFTLVAIATVTAQAQTAPANTTSNAGAVTPTSTACPAAVKCLANLEADVGAGCSPFPVPLNVFPTPLRTQGYNLTQIRPGLFSYYDGAYFAVLARNEKVLVVVDFPESLGTSKEDGSGTRITDAAEEVMDGNVPETVYMIYSHSHLDHIGTATKFYTYITRLYPDVKIVIVGSAGCAAALKSATSGRAPQVTEVIPDDSWSLDLSSNLKIQLSVVGGHSVDDVLLFVPPVNEYGGFVHLVDLVFPGWVPFSYFAITKDLRRFIAAHEKALELDFAVLSGGHLTRLGTKQDVEVSLEYTRDVVSSATNAVKTVTNFTDILTKVRDSSAPEAGNLWYAFGHIRALQTNTCYKGIVGKWACRLAGMNEFGRSHCYTAVLYVILDL